MSELDDATWPRARVAEAMTELAERAGLSGRSATVEAVPSEGLKGHRFDLWMERTAASLSCESEACISSFSRLDEFVHRASPAIVELDEERFLAVLRSSSTRLTLLLPGNRLRHVRPKCLSEVLKKRASRELDEAIEAELAPLALSPRRARRAREALAAERLAERQVAKAWFLRGEPSEGLLAQLRRDGVHSRIALALLCHLGFTAAWIASWYILGRGVFSGGISQGWFFSWLLCLVTMAVLRAVTSYTQTGAGIRFIAALKRLLLVGALSREQDETAGEGISQNLAYVYESTSLENNGLRGIVSIVLTTLELLYAPFILAAGAGGWLHGLAFLLWSVLAAFAVRRLWHERMAWTDARFAVSRRGLDALLGQRTRRVQGRKHLIEREDDRALAAYATATERLDRRKLAVIVGLSRGWMVVGTLSLIPAMAGEQWTSVSLALSVGGILFAYQALRGLGHSVEQLASSLVAWSIIQPIVKAAGRRFAPGLPEVMAMSIPKGGTVLEADGLRYTYPTRASAAVSDTSLRIREGERVLLEGASGCGKSTLAQLLAGHRVPQAGGLSLGGMDLASVGVSEWRRRVALVPQFHLNHILMGPLALNLLLGRRWPPSHEDVQLAYEVCQELGLDTLIDEMPSGMWQMVGQTGWQLSHGERSRVFLARALLQDADVLIVDESLSALDPEHVGRAARCVMRRAPSLVLVAHP